MAGPKSSTRLHLDQLLADGHWHDREAVLTILMARVPPGEAARQAQHQRAVARRQAGNAGPARSTLSRRGDDIRVGARTIARRVIESAIANGAIERRTEGGLDELRVRPPADIGVETRDRLLAAANHLRHAANGRTDPRQAAEHAITLINGAVEHLPPL